MQKAWIIFLMTLVSFTWANTPVWECKMSDGNQMWEAQSSYQRKAYATVFDACKKKSANPAACTRKNIQCEAFLNGLSTTVLWKCKALDANAQAYPGSLLTNKEQAAISARENCQDQSDIPDTCYVYLFTCVNQHEQLS